MVDPPAGTLKEAGVQVSMVRGPDQLGDRQWQTSSSETASGRPPLKTDCRSRMTTRGSEQSFATACHIEVSGLFFRPTGSRLFREGSGHEADKSKGDCLCAQCFSRLRCVWWEGGLQTRTHRCEWRSAVAAGEKLGTSRSLTGWSPFSRLHPFNVSNPWFPWSIFALAITTVGGAIGLTSSPSRVWKPTLF